MRITRWYENGLRAAAAGAVALVMAWCGSAFGGTTPPLGVTIEINENCQGTIVAGEAVPVPLPCTLHEDPLAPGHAPTVFYLLSTFPAFSTVFSGDLLLGEEPGQFSDQIRFESSSPGPGIFFYSDIIDGVDALADTGLPAFLQPLLVDAEVGSEGNNGINYTPINGGPGFVPNFAVTYIIHSDSASAPEPATLALLGLGLAGLGFSRRRKLN